MQVSGDIFRRSTKIFCSRTGKNNTRSVGSFSIKRRSQIRLHDKASILGSKTNKCHCTKRSYFTVGGRKIVTKRCNRTCPSSRNENRFIINILCSSKENKRLETNHKSKTSEQVSKETAFQNELSKQGYKSSKKRRLGNFNRSGRCLSAYTNTYEIQKVSPILHTRKSLPVHLSFFRSNASPEDFYKGSVGNCSTPEIAKCPSSSPVYLDDWFIINQLRNLLLLDKEKALNLLVRLGLMIKLEKSALVPSQRVIYIGSVFLMDKGIVCPTSESIQKIEQAIFLVIREPIVHNFLHLLGLMASCIELIPNARLFMRPIQLHLLHFWRPVTGELQAKVPITQHLLDYLKWWKNKENLLQGKPFCPEASSKILTTDAFKHGYGGHLENHICQGTWSKET